MPRASDVIVVGGGVIGCSIAYHLAKLGVKVTLLERDGLGSQASSAASGVLTTSPGAHPYSRLGRESLALFHQLAPELQEAGGVDIELVECGELALALSEDEAIELRSYARRFNQMGGDARWLDQKELHELEPELNPSIPGAMFSPETCRVNNQRLSEAFARAAIRLGADVRQGAGVTGLLREGQRVTGVRLHGSELRADHVVIAAGPWSSLIAEWIGVDLPVRPVKGQNLNLQPARIAIRTVIHGSWTILVPRNDGSVVAGATLEDAGFDSRVTAGGVQAILSIATALVPMLQTATINWTVAGLRPGSPDDMPIIGPVPGWEGLSVASGHYRNGILLSAITGKLLAEYLTGSEPELLAAFSPARFLS